MPAACADHPASHTRPATGVSRANSTRSHWRRPASDGVAEGPERDDARVRESSRMSRRGDIRSDAQAVRPATSAVSPVGGSSPAGRPAGAAARAAVRASAGILPTIYFSSGGPPKHEGEVDACCTSTKRGLRCECLINIAILRIQYYFKDCPRADSIDKVARDYI